MEALPRALGYHHDTMNDTGMSPYQILFGRDRPIGALRRGVKRECEDAQAFMDRMEEIDRAEANALTKVHEQQAERLNEGRPKKTPFQVEDWVWVQLLRGLTGPKLDTA